VSGRSSDEADFTNWGSITYFTIRNEVPAGKVIVLTGTFRQNRASGNYGLFDQSVEDEYRKTGVAEFGSIRATVKTNLYDIVGETELGPLATKKPERTYDDIVYLYGEAGIEALWGKDMKIRYSGNAAEKFYLDGSLIADYYKSLTNYLKVDMYNSGLVPYDVDSVEFYIPEEFDVYLDELGDAGGRVSVSEQHASDDSPFIWREKTDTVNAVRYQGDGKDFSEIGKIYVKPKADVTLEAKRYETYTSKKAFLSSPFAEDTIAVTDEEGTVGEAVFAHSYNFEVLPLDGSGYSLLMRMSGSLATGDGLTNNLGWSKVADLIAIDGKTLGKTITVKMEPSQLYASGIVCEDNWAELKLKYIDETTETITNPRGQINFDNRKPRVKEITISSTDFGDRWTFQPFLWVSEGSATGQPTKIEFIIGEAPNQTMLTAPFKIYNTDDVRITGIKGGLNIIEGDTLQIKGWENAEIQHKADGEWKALPPELANSFLKISSVFQDGVRWMVDQAVNRAGKYEIRHMANRVMDNATYSVYESQNLNVQSRVKVKEGRNNYYEEEGREEKPLFVYTHYDESNPDGREVTVSETYIKPADGGDGRFKLTPGVHKRDYEITHPESFEKTDEVTPGPGHHPTLEASVVVDGKPEITVQEKEFTTIPGGKLTGLLDAGQVTSVYHYYEYKNGKIVEDAQKPARITLTDYLGQPVLNGEYVAPLDPGTYYLTYESEAVDKVYVNGSNLAEPVQIKAVVTNGVEIETKNEIYVSDEHDQDVMKNKIAATGVWMVGSASGTLTKDQFQYSFTKKLINFGKRK